MVQKFSPSALHHGRVHGCFSARADLLIQNPPENKASIVTQGPLPQPSPLEGTEGTEGIATKRHINRTSYFPFCVLLYFFVASPSPLQLLYLCSPYADRPAKMCGVRQLCGYLPDGGDFHRFAEEPGVCQCGRMRRML